MALTDEEQALYDELIADPEIQQILAGGGTSAGAASATAPSRMNPRFYDYDSALARNLAPVEATIAPLAAGFARAATFGASDLVPGFSGAHETLEARSPRAVAVGSAAGAIPSIAASPQSVAGRAALNVAAPAGITLAETGDPSKAAVAGATGLAASLGGELLSSGARRAVLRSAENEAARSLGLTKGNIQRLGSTPSEMLERRLQLGRRALDEGLVSPLKATDELALLSEQVSREAGKPIGEVMETLSSAGVPSGVRGTDISEELAGALDPYIRDPLRSPEKGGAKRVLASVKKRHGSGNVSFDDLQKLKQDIGAEAYPVSPTGTAVVPGQTGYRPLQESYTAVKNIQERALDKAAKSNPDIVDFEKYLKDKKRYADLQEIERYLGSAAAGEMARNVVPLRAAIGGAAELAGGNITGAAATTAGLTAAQKRFHPAAARILDKMGKIMGSPYAAMAKETLQRGPRAFASWDFMMQQMEPGYRMLLKGEETEQ